MMSDVHVVLLVQEEVPPETPKTQNAQTRGRRMGVATGLMSYSRGNRPPGSCAPVPLDGVIKWVRLEHLCPIPHPPSLLIFVENPLKKETQFKQNN